MTESKIEKLYALGNGQLFFRVHGFPVRMTEVKMKRHAESEWTDFWRILMEGYDAFEDRAQPPNVAVRGGKHVFN